MTLPHNGEFKYAVSLGRVIAGRITRCEDGKFSLEVIGGPRDGDVHEPLEASELFDNQHDASQAIVAEWSTPQRFSPSGVIVALCVLGCVLMLACRMIAP